MRPFSLCGQRLANNRSSARRVARPPAHVGCTPRRRMLASYPLMWSRSPLRAITTRPAFEPCSRLHELSAEETAIYRQLDPLKIPQHVAIIMDRSEEHTSQLQSPCNLVCRLLL